MKKTKMIAFGLVVVFCMSILAPSLAWANSLSRKYDLSISGEYIKGIPAGVTVGELVSSMRYETTVTFNSESKAYVCTGCTVNISQRGSYYAVILGDVDGNGRVDTTDYLRIKQHCLNTAKLSGVFYEAADVDGNRSVDSTDYLRIKGHFLGSYDLYRDFYLDEDASEEPSEESSEDDSSNTRFEDMATVVKSGNFVDPSVAGYDSKATRSGSDPFVTYYGGKYYYPFMFWGVICVSSFSTLGGMTTDGAVNVFPANVPAEASQDIWSPKMYFIDGRWYIYYSASDGNLENHRMYVLRSKTSDAMGEYEFIGKVSDSTDRWAANGAVFEYKNQLYFTWSGWEGYENVAQNIYIAKMSSPTKISSERVCLSVPEKSWEVQGGSPLINDVPCAITSGDYLTLLYSASGSWCDDYCIGQLLFMGGNVLDPANWSKQSNPVLQTDPAHFYAPGNACVTTDDKGIMWMVFHGNKDAGKGWNDRSIFMKPIRIKENGAVEVLYDYVKSAVENAGFIDPSATDKQADNPIRLNAPDPHITCHNGKYYWVGGIWGNFFVIEMDVFDKEHLSDLATNNLFTYEKVKFIGLEVEGLDQYTDAWAPELHFINGYWYIYFSAVSISDGERRMYVSRADNEEGYIGGKYTQPKQLWTDDKWALDGSVFEYKGQMYFIWSGWPGEENVTQCIYIAKMSSPMQVSSERVCLSTPYYSWETDKGTMPENPTVNEGPVAISSGDYLTIVYSASGSWCDGYCLGQLVFQGGDVLDVNNWYKHPQPILQTVPGMLYGPGHNCFITDENGVIWVVFHAKTVGGTTGWDGRHTFMYPIRIKENGIVEVVLY